MVPVLNTSVHLKKFIHLEMVRFSREFNQNVGCNFNEVFEKDPQTESCLDKKETKEN